MHDANGSVGEQALWPASCLHRVWGCSASYASQQWWTARATLTLTLTLPLALILLKSD